MSIQNQGGPRSMDGPIRREPGKPLGSPISSPPRPVNPLATQPVAPASSPAESPVFEYRKPKKVRVFWRYGRLVAIGVVVLCVASVGWFGFKGLSAAHKIIAKSNGIAPALAGTLNLTQLKGEGDGRVNILVMGIGGAGHDGPNLSDTMMVWSLDPKTKDVAMLSIPRDLYVKIPGHGYGKINSANALGGPTLAMQVVQNVIGVPIHYYTVVDFSGFKQAVDAVGGIDVTVDAAINDPTYPCDNDRGYCPLRIAAGPQHMNGTQALRYSRSRHSTSDFDRAARQQKVLVALRQKSLQVSTLTNPVKMSGLIDAIGGHLKTDLQLPEMKKLASIAKDIDTTKITQKVLDTTGPDSLLVDGSGQIDGAGSIELPRAGTFNYSNIQDFVKNIFVDHYITDENARIEVQNGSGITGLATGVVTSLRAAHYNVSDPLNAPDHLTQTVIYDYTSGKKPYTINYLEHRFGVKVQKAAVPAPSTNASGVAVSSPEIRIILGSDYKPQTSSN